MAIKINDYLLKEKWYRRQTIDSVNSDSGLILPTVAKGVRKVSLTQEDFICEVNPMTHKIMHNKFLAPRPIWEKRKDAEGRSYLTITGWEDVSRVTLGLHADIILKKISHYAASGIDIFNESKKKSDDDIYQTLLSHYERAGMNFAFMEVITSLFNTCDAAIYQYVENGEIRWKVFSYLNGDTIYPTIDDEGNEVIARKFSYHDREAVEIYSTKSVQFWVLDDNNDSWWKRWVGWLVSGNKEERSEDGYRLVYEKPISGNRNPVTYFRINDLPTAPAQSLLDNLERVLSGLSEENKYYAYQMLFIKSSGLKELPMVGANGKVFAATGENDDMKPIIPANSSNTITIEISEAKEQIAIATQSVFISGDMLKGGELTSSAIEQLYRAEIQWCQLMQAKLYHSTKKMLMVFKDQVGIAEQKTFEYSKLPISFFQKVWTPRNESEMIENTTKKVYAGILSRKGAMSQMDDNIRGDYEQVTKEMEQKAALGSKDKNPNEPPIDNNSVNKGVLDNTGA